MRFGVSECTTWPWSYERDVTSYQALGVDAIEIWEFKLDRDPQRRRNQLRLARAGELAVSSFQADVHALFPTRMKPDPAEPAERYEAFAGVLDACAPELPGTVFVLNTGIAKGGNVEAAFSHSVPFLRKLARRAETHGVTLALEPLHPLAMNEDSFAWNLEDALDLVTAVDHPALGICADSWNLAGQYDLRARLARCAERIFLAQVSDYRRPRSYLDRVAVGDGSIDFAPFLAGLNDAHYDGPLVLEIFSKDVSDSLYDTDLAEVIARSRRALERLCGAIA